MQAKREELLSQEKRGWRSRKSGRRLVVSVLAALGISLCFAAGALAYSFSDSWSCWTSSSNGYTCYSNANGGGVHHYAEVDGQYPGYTLLPIRTAIAYAPNSSGLSGDVNYADGESDAYVPPVAVCYRYDQTPPCASNASVWVIGAITNFHFNGHTLNGDGYAN